jgi:putative ABC transport system permease protein
MNGVAQSALVTSMFLRTIPQRLGQCVTAAVGVAGVVIVMVGIFSILEGFRATLANTGSADTALVMRSGIDSEMSSSIPLEHSRIIADAPGILRGPDGPVASAELYVIVDLDKRSTGTEANVPFRGVQPAAFDVRGNIEIVEGRRFEPGRNEIIVGVGAQREFAGLDVGNVLRWGTNDWTVVGVFEADGSLFESELWTDLGVLGPAYRRATVVQSVYAKLESEEAFSTFKDALTTDSRLQVRVMRENEYYADQSETLAVIINALGSIVITLMGIGAVFGAIITMHSAVAARTREIATLRALGFGSGPVAVSVIVESLLLALAGGFVGAAGARLWLNGVSAATLNFQTFSQVVFNFQVTPRLLMLGMGSALVMGLVGGIFPAIRASRLPIAVALREL